MPRVRAPRPRSSHACLNIGPRCTPSRSEPRPFTHHSGLSQPHRRGWLTVAAVAPDIYRALSVPARQPLRRTPPSTEHSGPVIDSSSVPGSWCLVPGAWFLADGLLRRGHRESTCWLRFNSCVSIRGTNRRQTPHFSALLWIPTLAFVMASSENDTSARK